MVRSLVCTPPSQLLEHLDHSVYSDHWQSMGPPTKKKFKKKVSQIISMNLTETKWKAT